MCNGPRTPSAAQDVGMTINAGPQSSGQERLPTARGATCDARPGYLDDVGPNTHVGRTHLQSAPASGGGFLPCLPLHSAAGYVRAGRLDRHRHLSEGVHRLDKRRCRLVSPSGMGRSARHIAARETTCNASQLSEP